MATNLNKKRAATRINARLRPEQWAKVRFKRRHEMRGPDGPDRGGAGSARIRFVRFWLAPLVTRRRHPPAHPGQPLDAGEQQARIRMPDLGEAIACVVKEQGFGAGQIGRAHV